jgi:hypothetical protein
VEPLDYAVPTPAKPDAAASAPIPSTKRPRPSGATSLGNETEEPATKKRRFDEVPAPASKTPKALAVLVDCDDPTLVSSLAPLQANGDARIVEPPRSGAEPGAKAQARETLDEGGTRLTNGEIADISVVSIREPSPLLPARSPSIQLVSTSKAPKRKWHAKAFISDQAVANDYFETPPGSSDTHVAVVDSTSVPLTNTRIQTKAASQGSARYEGAEDGESLDLDFEEVEEEGTAVEQFEQIANTTDRPEGVTSSSLALENSIEAANGVSPNISDNKYQHPMPQHADVPDIFSDQPVEDNTRAVIRSWLSIPSKSQKGSRPVKEGVISGHLDQGNSRASQSTQSFKQASEPLHPADGYSQSPLPSSSAPHSPISSIPTHTLADVNDFELAKNGGEGNRTSILKSGPTGGLPRARAPPRGVPIPVRESSPLRRSSPLPSQKGSRVARRRTFGGWPTIIATSSLRKEGAEASNLTRKQRDSTPALPTTMVYRDQEEDADWLRSVEKQIKVIPQYADPRKRTIPLFLPESSSDDTNTADGSEDEDEEDDLAEKVSRMSSLDIDRIWNVLNVAPRIKVLKQWKRQNKSDAWIIWNGLDFVLEELATRFNTGVTAAREAWAAAGDLVVTEKALYHAQEMARRTVADVIKTEAAEASKRRMEIWTSNRRTSERWGPASRRTSRLYQHSGGPPAFVPAEAVQVAVEAASSPWHDRDVRRVSSKDSHDELPMLSFDGVGPGGVSILRE